jgi:hypothetical protein
MGKTVYILGAGFSRPAGFPLQGELLRSVLDEAGEDILRLSGDILSAPVTPSDKIRNDRETIRQFTDASFPSRERVQLEDMFTLLDETILERAHFAKFPENKLREIRSAWIRAILSTLHQISEQHLKSLNMRYRAIAAALIEQRLRAKIKGDPFSIISLNWDSLIEDSIFWVLRKVNAIQEGKALADIDYCIYTTPLPNSPHTPSTKQRAKHIYNIKLLKMHGSSTWLRCPCSNLVYTGLGMDGPAYDIYVKSQISPFIQDHLDAREQPSPSILEPFIITPTFTKVFDLPHIQTTWHNAFVELREATDVVFIGYSLPAADYHFRTLLRRAIRSTTPIKVILDNSAEPLDPTIISKTRATLRVVSRLVRSGFPALAKTCETLDEALPKELTFVYPEDRYREIFKKEQLAFNYDGVEGFAKNFAPEDQLPVALERIKNSFLSK